jgi:hypothetical protein
LKTIAKEITKKEINVSYLIDRICGNLKDLNNKIRAIYYDETSNLIHWGRVVSRFEAKKMFHDTLEVIQELYSKYEPSFLAPKPINLKR